MSDPLDVSTGNAIEFTFDGAPASGTIVGSRVSLTEDSIVEVNVVTQFEITEGARLNVPGFIEGTGLAHPFPGGGAYQVVLHIPFAMVDRSTISGR